MTARETASGCNLARTIEGHDPDHAAVIASNRTLTYGELVDRTARLRGGLASLGIGDGDRVAVICHNGAAAVVSLYALTGMGAVIVPLNPNSPPAELEHQLATVGARAAVVGRGLGHAWRALDRDRVPSLQHVVSVETGAIAGAADYDELLRSEPVGTVDVDPDHLAVLMFTSGTAGAPHAAMLSHGNLLSNQRQAASMADPIGPDDLVYGVVPLYHIYGLNAMLGGALAAGATVLLVQRFDPATAVESIRTRGVTVLPGVPSMWTDLAQLDAPADAFATVRRATSGAAKLPVPVAEMMRERFGVDLAEGYGLTEASPVVTSSVGLPVRFGSVGKVVAGVEVRVVDEDGSDVLVGDAGEIWVRGPNVFQGYLDDQAATDRVLTPDGWLRTGDIAIVDADGWLYLVDRVKDLIIVSGFNVFPAEVEDVLLGHPEVAEVAVVGVPHPHSGEAVKAFVVLEPDSEVEEDDLIDYARDHLARYKCPSKVVFVDYLPRNPAGKLVRRELEEELFSRPRR